MYLWQTGHELMIQIRSLLFKYPQCKERATLKITERSRGRRYLSLCGLVSMGVVTCVSIICGFYQRWGQSGCLYSSEKDKPCDQRICTSADNTHYCDIITARPHDDIYILLHTTFPFSLLQSFLSLFLHALLIFSPCSSHLISMIFISFSTFLPLFLLFFCAI